MHASAMRRFENARLARMSSGHYCVIRDLGLVKGGKGLRHHEVVLQLSCRGLFAFAKSVLLEQARWISVRLNKTRQDEKLEPGSDSVSTGEALGFLVERRRGD
jgi:hypothetical protein